MADDLAPKLGPLVNSCEADDVEAQLKQQFLDLFMSHLRSSERELNIFGAPHLGSISLIEKHVKREGLALIRGDDPAMKYLFRAWRARNPKRGFHFLRTYLQLLWPNGWIVDQLWQDKNLPYPTALRARELIQASDPHATHYLTSRVKVSIDDSTETGVSIPSVLPALRSVVAARFTLDITLLRRFKNSGGNGLGLANVAMARQHWFYSGQAALPGV